MKLTRVVVILLLCSGMMVPVFADSDERNLSTFVNQTISVPPTGTAPLGSKESMGDYQAWLDECSSAAMAYSNSVLEYFGIHGFYWGDYKKTSVTTVQATAQTALPTPTPAIPESTRVRAAGQIVGGSGKQSVKIFVPSDYWELTYTVDPLETGGQESHSATGSNSAIFPKMTITIIDTTTGKVFDTVEPPGGLDRELWKRSDPRPWYKRYYAGNRTFEFDVYAYGVKSYTIEPRVPR
jgi:hypothetical protein